MLGKPANELPNYINYEHVGASLQYFQYRISLLNTILLSYTYITHVLYNDGRC